MEGKLVRDELPEWKDRFGNFQTTPASAMQQAPANRRATLGDYVQLNTPLLQNPAPPTSSHVPGPTSAPLPQRNDRRNHAHHEANVDHAPLPTATPSHPSIHGAKSKDRFQPAIIQSHGPAPIVPHDQRKLHLSPMVVRDPFGGPLTNQPVILYNQPLCPLLQSPMVARDQLPHQPMLALGHPNDRSLHSLMVAHDRSQGQLPNLHTATESGSSQAPEAVGNRGNDDFGTASPAHQPPL